MASNYPPGMLEGDLDKQYLQDFDSPLDEESEAVYAVHMNCHPDCGPIVDRADGMHCHENIDGRCWHENGDKE